MSKSKINFVPVKNPDSLEVHLKQLVLEAELRLQELGGHVFANNVSSSSSSSSYLLYNNVHNTNAGHSRSASISGLTLGPAGNGSIPSFATPSVSVSTADSVSVTSTSSTSSSGDKQLSIWDRRVKSLKRMLLGFEQASENFLKLLIYFIYCNWYIMIVYCGLLVLVYFYYILWV